MHSLKSKTTFFYLLQSANPEFNIFNTSPPHNLQDRYQYQYSTIVIQHYRVGSGTTTKVTKKWGRHLEEGMGLGPGPIPGHQLGEVLLKPLQLTVRHLADRGKVKSRAG